MPSSIRILGVDPGTLVTGFGVIDWSPKGLLLVEYGVVRTGATMSMPLRLRMIHLGLMEVIERTMPDEFAIESAFYSKNVQSTLKLGHARGVSILAAALREIPTAEYAPREVKQAVVGNGNAGKEQVAYMARTLLNLSGEELPLDATDALAVAICHSIRLGSFPTRGGSKAGSNGRKGNWAQFIKENPDRVAGGNGKRGEKGK